MLQEFRASRQGGSSSSAAVGTGWGAVITPMAPPRVGCSFGNDESFAELVQVFLVEKSVGASRNKANLKKKDCHEERF